MGRMRTLSIAAIQTRPIFGDLDGTWKHFADQMRSVRDLWSHVQLVVPGRRAKMVLS